MKNDLTKQGVYKNLVAKGIKPIQALAMAKQTLNKPKVPTYIAKPIKKKKKTAKKMKSSIKKTGKFQGKSNAVGYGGRAAQLKARGVPGGVIGNLARAAGAAPGQKNFHGKKAKKYKSR